MNWEKIDDTFKLTTPGDEYGFFVIPNKHNTSLYDVYMCFGFCNMQLISDCIMELKEAKEFAENIINNLKTLK